MKQARALLMVAGFFFFSICAGAAEAGKVCDRYGVLLMEVHRDADGTIVRTYPLKAFAAHLLHGLSPAVYPAAGETVYLTIDAKMQMAAEQALRAVGRGCAVLIDPATGDILAMASVPSFDPGEMQASLSSDPTQPLLNRAITAHTPGATFLPVTVLAGMSRGLGGVTHVCTGSMTLGKRTMRCWISDKGSGHGLLDMAGGIKNSCNTYFYSLGIATGVERMTEISEFLGLGRASGLPILHEGEGLVDVQAEAAKSTPFPKWPGSLASLPDWLERWQAYLRGGLTPGYAANMAIGQGCLRVTPMQMGAVAGTLANGGDIWALRLVDRITKADGRVETTPKTRHARLSDKGISPSDVLSLRNAMFSSVNDPGGNAQKGAAPGFRVAGRTGTAQVWRGHTSDSITAFIGFAEAPGKLIAFSVWVEGAKSGGGVAAPLAARILGDLTGVGPEPLAPAPGSFDHLESLD